MPFINESTTEHEFNQTLQSLKNDSKLAEHWITNHIISVFLIMLYIRAEREGDFSLHLYACHRIVPCFFKLELRKGQYSVPSHHGEPIKQLV